MSNTDQNRRVAESFSGHRFRDTYAHLAPEVEWLSRGESSTVGRDAVIAACDASAQELARMTTEFLSFRSLAEDDTVAIESVGRYTESDGSTSFVASCDIYDFTGGQLARITSYAAEIDDPRHTEAGH